MSISDTGNAGGGQASGEAGAQNSGQTGGQQTGSEFLAGLAPENREFFSKKGWKSLDDAFKSHREAETLISKGAHKGAAAGDGQQQTAEVPANPGGYQFKLPDGLPQNFPYDKTFAGKFAEWAHGQQIPVKTAQALHDNYVQYMAENFGATSAAEATKLNESVAKTYDDLVKSWGEAETPAFKQNVEMAKRAMKHLDPDLKTALTEIGVIRKIGNEEIVTNSTIMKALAKAGSGLFAEDNLFGNQTQNDNPFDPKKPNLTRQGELIKSDPELARTLIRAAGVESDWGHFLNPRGKRR